MPLPFSRMMIVGEAEMQMEDELIRLDSEVGG